jgi:hypothetical protein
VIAQLVGDPFAPPRPEMQRLRAVDDKDADEFGIGPAE